MEEIDTYAILRDIYRGHVGPHFDLYERSVAHREEHGEACDVYPSSPEDGSVWPFLATLVGARRLLEVGCGLGYTAALLAEAAGPEGRVDTIERTAWHADLAEEEFQKRGLAGRIRVLRGEARDVLPRLKEPYDVLFADASWEEYPDFLPHLVRLTRSGGVLVSANLFPLFEGWAQDMPHKEKVREYLTALVRAEGFRTYVIPGRWHALSYRL